MPVKGQFAQFLVPMVDGTDFASVESGITESDFNSGATRKFYGVNHGVSDAYTSGTISKTGRLVRSGVFQLTLKGSENNYDRMQMRIAKTGCAEQIYEWENDAYSHSDLMSRISDVASDLRSYLVGMSAMLSDTHSAAILGASHASDAHSAASLGASRALLIQSRLSDFDSRLVSDVSDLMSMLTALSDAVSNAYSAAAVGASRTLLVQSRLSDLDSRVASDLSDVYSLLSDLESNFGSRVPKEVASKSLLSDVRSDLRSQISGIEAAVGASAISDIASAVWAHTIGARVDSRVLLTQSHASDAASAASQGNSRILLVQSRLSDFDSRLVSDVSDIRSMLTGMSDILSAAHAAALVAVVGASRTLLVQSRLSDLDSRLASELSDVYSLLSDLNSNILSRVPKEVASKSLLSDVHSDLKSAVGAVSVTITASDISDIASAVVAALPITSMVSDIYSLLSDLESNFGSRVPKLVATNSQVSDLASDLRSVLVSLSAAVSDAHSAAILAASHASDAHSAAGVGNSRLLIAQSRLSDLDSRLASDLSDVYSLLSDLESNFGSRVPKRVSTDSQLSGLVSDLQSQLAAGVELGASSLSDLRSAIAATELDASDLSDIASAVWARAGAEPGGVPSVGGSMGAKMDWLFVMSRNKLTQTATVQSVRNDADSADIASAAVSDDGTTFIRGEFA